MNGWARTRIGIGVLLLAIGISGLLAFGLWQQLLAGLSPDGIIMAYSWLLLRLMLIALLPVGIVLLGWRSVGDLISRWHHGLRRLPATAFLTLALGGAAALRIIAVLILPLRLYSDFSYYDELGWLWAAHGEFTDGTGPTAYYPPGWPFLLSRLYLIFGRDPHLGIVAIIAFSVAIVYLTWRLVRSIWGEFPARWAAVIIALLPSEVLFANILGSESLFTFLLMLSFVLLLPRDGNGMRSITLALAGGVALGFATLTRSVALLVPMVLIPVYLASRIGLKQAAWRWAVAVVGLLIVVAPWMARNDARIGRATICTNVGVNLHMGNNPNAGVGYNQPDPHVLRLDSAANEAHDDSVGWALGMQYIRAHPLAFLVRGALKSVFLLANDTDALLYELTTAATDGVFNGYCALALLTQSFWMLLLIPAIIGIARFLRPSMWRDPGGLLLLGTVFYWIAVHFVFYGAGRYHMPIVPILAAFAARSLAPPGDR